MSVPAVLVPVKAFAKAKGRLGDALAPADRAALARELATAVVAACDGLDVYVVCDDPDVAAWARTVGASVIDAPRPGLDAAVRHGVAVLRDRGVARVLITHADLSAPGGLRAIAEREGTVVVPDRHLDGTNVLLIPTDVHFAFSYGERSFARHLSEAERCRGPLQVVRDPGLALDVDDPDDLARHRATPAADPVTTAAAPAPSEST